MEQNDRNLPYRIVLLQEKHLDEAAVLEQLCFSEPWSRRSLQLLLQRGQAIGVACEQNGHCIAYGGMLLTPFEGQITNLAVHPDARHRGIGTALLQSLLDQAEDSRLEAVFLEVRVSNIAAISLYRKMRFSVLGRRKNFYRFPTEDAFVMGYSGKDPAL